MECQYNFEVMFYSPKQFKHEICKSCRKSFAIYILSKLIKRTHPFVGVVDRGRLRSGGPSLVRRERARHRRTRLHRRERRQVQDVGHAAHADSRSRTRHLRHEQHRVSRNPGHQRERHRRCYFDRRKLAIWGKFSQTQFLSITLNVCSRA